MLLSGDELGRTQQGNNNAYCQDNELSWVDWANQDTSLLEFTRSLIGLRRDHPIFRRRRWFEGRELRGGLGPEIAWFTPTGEEMRTEDWQAGFAKSLLIWLNGEAIAYSDRWGERVVDDSFCLLFNAHFETLTFTLPSVTWGHGWEVVLDTGGASDADRPAALARGWRFHSCHGQSLVVLRCRPTSTEDTPT